MRIPPLNAFRTFEAAGRHQNFLKASEELHVTPSAVSRQVKVLEEYLGVSLFERRNQRVHLTELGRRYLDFATLTLGQIEARTGEVIASAETVPLRISSPRLFATGWLIPRLGRFQERYPSQSVNLSFGKSAETPSQDIDVAFRKGRGDWPGMTSIFLMQIVLVPVCSPGYLAAHGPISDAIELNTQTLLDAPEHSENWAAWLAGYGARLNNPRKLWFQETGLAYQAALEGMGIAIGRRGMIDVDLLSGRLVEPLRYPVQSADAIYLTHHHRGRLPPRVVHFNRWVLQEVKNVSSTNSR